MTHGELMSAEPSGPMEGGALVPTGNWPGYPQHGTIPEKYVQLFKISTEGTTLDPTQKPDDVADLVTTVIRDIVVRGDESYQDAPVPVSGDMRVISMALDAVAKTPLSDAYGRKLRMAQDFWNRFRDGSANASRQLNGLARSDAVNVLFRLPVLAPRSKFDPLEKAYAINAEVIAYDVHVHQLGRLAQYCSFDFRGLVSGEDMRIGDASVGSKFLFRDGYVPLNNARSFRHAKDVSINISTRMSGKIGPLKGTSHVYARTSAEGNGLEVLGWRKSVNLDGDVYPGMSLVNPMSVAVEWMVSRTPS